MEKNKSDNNTFRALMRAIGPRNVCEVLAVILLVAVVVGPVRQKMRMCRMRAIAKVSSHKSGDKRGLDTLDFRKIYNDAQRQK